MVTFFHVKGTLGVFCAAVVAVLPDAVADLIAQAAKEAIASAVR